MKHNEILSKEKVLLVMIQGFKLLQFLEKARIFHGDICAKQIIITADFELKLKSNDLTLLINEDSKYALIGSNYTSN